MGSLGNVLKCLIFCMVLHCTYGKRNFFIQLNSCNYTFNPVYVEKVSCTIKKTFNDTRAFFDAQLKHQIESLQYSFDVIALKNNKQQITIFNSTGNDACNFLGGKVGMNFLKILRDLLVTYGNLPKKCPIDKDFHFMFNDVRLDPEKLPPYIPETAYILHSSVYDNEIFIISFKVFGEIKHKVRKFSGQRETVLVGQA